MSAETINLDVVRGELEAARVERDLWQATQLLDPVRAARFRDRMLAIADDVMPTLRHHTREQAAFRVKVEKLVTMMEELSQGLRELPGTVHVAALEQSLERLGMLLHLPTATGDELMPIIPLIDATLSSLRRVCNAMPVAGEAPAVTSTGTAGTRSAATAGTGSGARGASSATPMAAKLERALQQLTTRLARDFRKELVLEIEGLERLPDSLYTTIYDVCCELLTNAAEHGVESPAARLAAGKDTKARLQLQLRARPGGLTLNMRDDGRGLDVTGIFRSAARLGLWPDDGRNGDPREAARLIFKPGVTTSGDAARGKGLRRVLTQLKKLGARIRVASERGQHLRVCADLPQSAVAGEPVTRARA